MVCSIFKSVCTKPIVPPCAAILMYKIGSNIIDGIQFFQQMEQNCPAERSLFQIKSYSPQCQEDISEFWTSGMYTQLWTTALVALLVFAALYNHRVPGRPVRAVQPQALPARGPLRDAPRLPPQPSDRID